MESDKKMRRKTQKVNGKHFTLKSFMVCLSFFVFLLFVSSERSFIAGGSFRPVIKVPSLSLFPSRLIRDSYRSSLPLLSIEARVVFPDDLLVILSRKVQSGDNIGCIYRKMSNSSTGNGMGEIEGEVVKPPISVEDYQEVKSVVRCPLPPVNCSAAVELRWMSENLVPNVGYGERLKDNWTEVSVPSWDRLVYEAMLDRNTAVVFVKGLNLRPHVESNPRQFRCHFRLNNFDKEDEGYVISTRAITASQEVIRCLLPRSIQKSPEKAVGIRVTISRFYGDRTGTRRNNYMPSAAKIYDSKSYKSSRRWKYEICGCTMLWNQAPFLREWITYHGWLGVERWFIYDNKSDDELNEVVEELNLQNYNISRHAWPWIKAQEAGFSHCAMRARDECKWVAFFDVDEFFFFPRRRGQLLSGKNSLRNMVANYTKSPTIGEIRTVCHSYGPSGLSAAPPQGVMAGYACRLQAPERHKSIVRTDFIDTTLLNAVHHFKLRQGYRYVNLPESTGVVNHYKYQAWDTFKTKFFRRVSTYVVNWQEDENQGSKDRAPGLGTEAIEPTDWRFRFCELWDTGLKDFISANFADPATGTFPWERSRSTSHLLGK